MIAAFSRVYERALSLAPRLILDMLSDGLCAIEAVTPKVKEPRQSVRRSRQAIVQGDSAQNLNPRHARARSNGIVAIYGRAIRSQDNDDSALKQGQSARHDSSHEDHNKVT